jgi:hypothetical protein
LRALENIASPAASVVYGSKKNQQQLLVEVEEAELRGEVDKEAELQCEVVEEEEAELRGEVGEEAELHPDNRNLPTPGSPRGMVPERWLCAMMSCSCRGGRLRQSVLQHPQRRHLLPSFIEHQILHPYQALLHRHR